MRYLVGSNIRALVLHECFFEEASFAICKVTKVQSSYNGNRLVFKEIQHSHNATRTHSIQRRPEQLSRHGIPATFC